MKKKLLILLLVAVGVTANAFAGCNFGGTEGTGNGESTIERPDNKPDGGDTSGNNGDSNSSGEPGAENSDNKKPDGNVGDNKPNGGDEQEEPHRHTFNKKVAEARYLKTPATISQKAVYYYSCFLNCFL